MGLALCPLVPGCSIEPVSDPDVDRMVDALCQQEQRCACPSEAGESECAARRDLWQERLTQARAKGLQIDRDCLKRQLDMVTAQGCSSAFDSGDETHLCQQQCSVFHGTKSAGASCTAKDPVVSTCGPGLACVDGSCVSACEALSGGAEGTFCDPFTWPPNCAMGLSCSPASTRCIRSPTAGQSCLNGECDALTDCVRGTCQARSAQGGSCRDVGCLPGLSCAWDVGICKPFARELESCVGLECANSLFCLGDDLCHAAAALGQTCERRPCAQGSYCHPELATCVALPDGEGQPCPSGSCAGGFFCDQRLDPEGECLPLAELGAACRGHNQCAQAFCPAGYCEIRPALGEDCSDAGLCQFGARCDRRLCIEDSNYGPAVCSYPGW